MPKEGIDISKIKPIISDVNKRCGWALCIGSGISVPIFPNWYQLVEEIIKSNCEPSEAIEITKLKELGISADGMIQSVKNILNVEDDMFAMILSESLYSKLRMNLSEKEWKNISKVLDSSNPNVLNDRVWKEFIKVRNKLFYKTSANAIAKVVLKSIEQGIGPQSILSFNAEALLLAIINSYIREPYIGKIKRRNDTCKGKFDKIVSGISNRSSQKIPYIFCHGTLPTYESPYKKFEFGMHKLVFSESSYLQLSNNAFSWQANSFINMCANHRVIFIGLSLTDANIRKWLSWVHSNRIDEYKKYNLDTNESTNHYWINKKPKTDIEKKWIEASVAHLGIRMIWINDWDEIGVALGKLLNI